MAKAKFDLRTEAARPLYAGVGVTDLAVGAVRDYVADVQKRFVALPLEPKVLREQAATVVGARVDALARDARARRAAVEARVAGNVATVTEAYTGLAERGETLVSRIRGQESTQAAVSAGRTTVAKARTTRTQAAGAAKSTAADVGESATSAAKTAAKKTTQKAAQKAAEKTATARKRSAAPRASAKATSTAARTTAARAARAATDGAAKVGD